VLVVWAVVLQADSFCVCISRLHRLLPHWPKLFLPTRLFGTTRFSFIDGGKSQSPACHDGNHMESSIQ
jgi:hypothetical protein